jgi:outer membrane protein OmpA-like peptidoglycan-associated protein
MQRRRLAGLCAAILMLGCQSGYQRTYDEELGRLEAEQALRDQAEAEARAQAQIEARKYVAVVYFDVGKSMISEDGYRELQWFVEKMQPYPTIEVDVKGYADATGTEQGNQELSEQRANNVASFLIQQGIPPAQIAPAGFSSNFPDEPNETAKGRSRNRRVEVRAR